MQKPSGSASRADWADYAIHLGHDRAKVAAMTRNGIRDLVKADPKQEEDTPAPVDEEPVEDTVDGEPDAEPEPSEESTAPDYSQFLNTARPGDEPDTGAAAGQQDDEPAGQQPALVPTGATIKVGSGESRAVCVLGTYQVLDDSGARHTVDRGQVLEGPEWAVARGVEIGLLQRL